MTSRNFVQFLTSFSNRFFVTKALNRLKIIYPTPKSDVI